MELQTVEIKVPKGFVREGFQLFIDEVHAGDTPVQFIADSIYGEALYLILRPIAKEKHEKQSKPDWTPPKLKKGWLTWDGNGGWWWWPLRPFHSEEYGWVDAKTGCGGDGEEIGEVMTEFLGCPDCTGFDERECIWEVGE